MRRAVRQGGVRVVGWTHNNSVVPGKYGKLIEPRNQVPSSGGVAGYEDSNRQGGEGVHRIAVWSLL